MSPYEIFHSYVYDKKEVSGLQKQLLYHLKAFGCKAYILIQSKDNRKYRHKRSKLDGKAHLGFVVEYKSTNIYRRWMFYTKMIVSVRDVILNDNKV